MWRLTPERDGSVAWIPGRLARDDAGAWSWEEADAPEPSDDLPVGLWTPPLVDAHTHLGDAFIRPERDTLPRDLMALVAPPDGIKHRRLAETDADTIQHAITDRARRMVAQGTACALDFREGGLDGMRMLREATDGILGTGVFARPAASADDEAAWLAELDTLLEAKADGIGLSALADLPTTLTEGAADACRKAGKPLAMHLSERIHEPMETALTLSPSLLVHLVHTTAAELVEAADDDVTCVACPTSNAFFGARAPLDRLHAASRDHGLPVAFGTDNAMLGDGDLRDEAAAACRLVPDADLGWLMAALTWTPWRTMAAAAKTPDGLAGGLVWVPDGAPSKALATAPDKIPLGRLLPAFETGSPSRWVPRALGSVTGRSPWPVL